MPNLTTWLKAINQTKQPLLDDPEDARDEAAYLPFVVNRCLSYFPDTIFQANEMNRRHGTDHKMQFDYLLQAVKKRKRFSPWLKAEKVEDIDTVKKFFRYSNRRALEALSLLTPEQIERIKYLLDTGGLRRGR
jgi:hypothetical protein